MKENESEGLLFRHHVSMEERGAVSETCMTKLALEMPALVDEMNDAAATAYVGVPERLCLIGRDRPVG